jgi:pilus assembly protein CpaE
MDNLLILLIQENPSDEHIRGALSNVADPFRVQSVENIPMALARIGGGGVDLVILDLSQSRQPEIERLDSFLKLRSNARQSPIIVVCDSEDDGLVMRAVKAGATDYLARTKCKADLGALVRSVMGRRRRQIDPRPPSVGEPHKAGVLTVFLGAKGGVGTTTVALNVASALAQWGKVILTEPRPMFGTLSQFFRPHHVTSNIARMMLADVHKITPVEVEAGLWPYRDIEGLSILFGPQTIEECQEFAAQSANAVVKVLSRLADYVVLDLLPCLSAGNRAIMQEADALVLVVERDPLCIKSAEPFLETIRACKPAPRLIGSVIVNRTPLAAPMKLSEIEMQLGIPTLGVIPPAADLCIAAQKAGMPLALFDPDSLAAHSLASLANALVMPSRRPARVS